MELALVAGGFTILGILIGALITHYLARHRDNEIRNKDRFDVAALKFRSIIAKELSEFKDRGGVYYDERVTHLPTIYAAYVEFFPTLNHSRQQELSKLWQQYEKYEKLRAITLLGMPDKQTENFLIQFLSFTE